MRKTAGFYASEFEFQLVLSERFASHHTARAFVSTGLNFLSICVLLRLLRMISLWMFIVPPIASAYPDYTVDWHSVDGGGMMYSIGGDYELGGTIGQPDPRNDGSPGTMIGGDYSATGGFWQRGLCGECQLYGDIYPPAGVGNPEVGNCVIDVDDISCVLDAFAGIQPCASIGDIHGCPDGSGVVDVDDISAVLDAFAGLYACPHPCPP